MKRWIHAAEDSATSINYISIINKLLDKFDAIDGTLLKEACEYIVQSVSKQSSPYSGYAYTDSPDELGIEGVDWSETLDLHVFKELYKIYSSALDNLNTMLSVLEGESNFKKTWTYKYVPSYEGEIFTKGSDKYEDYVEVINQALQACRDYDNDIQGHRGHYGYTDYPIVEEVNDIIRSGNSYTEIIDTIEDIVNKVFGGYKSISDTADGVAVNIGRDIKNVSTAKSQISRYMKANLDRYSGIELGDVERKYSGGDIYVEFYT